MAPVSGKGLQMNDMWSAIDAVSSAVSTLIVLVTAIIALRQIAEAVQARHVTGLAKVFEDFHSDEARRDRQFIYDNSFSEFSKCPPEIRDRVERVIELYQRTAFLAIRSLIPSDLILEMYSGAYVAVWQKLELYVTSKRAESGLSNYGASFEALARQAIDYRKTKFGDVNKLYVLGYTPPLEIKPSKPARASRNTRK